MGLTLLSNVSCVGNEDNILNCGNTAAQYLGSTECASNGGNGAGDSITAAVICTG